MIELEVHGRNIATLQDDGTIDIKDKLVFNMDDVTNDNEDAESSNVTNDSIPSFAKISNIEG